MKLLIAIAIIFCNVCSAQDAVNRRLQNFLNNREDVKTFVIKKKTNELKVTYSFTKTDSLLLAYQTYDRISGALTKYFFDKHHLIFVIYQPKKNDNQRTGGLYYFRNNSIKETEEYNIDPQDPDKFLKHSKLVLQNIKSILTTKR